MTVSLSAAREEMILINQAQTDVEAILGFPLTREQLRAFHRKRWIQFRAAKEREIEELETIMEKANS